MFLCFVFPLFGIRIKLNPKTIAVIKVKIKMTPLNIRNNHESYNHDQKEVGVKNKSKSHTTFKVYFIISRFLMLITAFATSCALQYG